MPLVAIAEVEGGALLFVSSKRAPSIGYRYYRIPNANIYRANPALDTHMLVFGVGFLH